MSYSFFSSSVIYEILKNIKVLRLASKSYILTSWFQYRSTSYESYLVNQAIKISRVSLFLHNLRTKSFILDRICTLPWKETSLLLFILSLSLIPGYDGDFILFLKENISNREVNRQAFILGIISFVILLSPLIILLLNQFRISSSKIILLRFEVLLIIFFISTEISTIFSFNTQASFSWLIKLIRSFLVYIIFSRLSLHKTHYQYIIYGFLISILIEFVFAVSQFFLGGLTGLPFENLTKVSDISRSIITLDEIPYFRVVGTFPHPNILSNYIILLLPIIIACMFSKNTYLKITAHFAAVSGLIILVLTLSRWGIFMGLLAFPIVCILIKNYLKLSFLKLTRDIKFYILIFVFILFSVLLSVSASSRFLKFSTDDPSYKARLDLIVQAVYVIQNNPLLGIGGKNFVNYLVNFDYTDSTVSKSFPGSVHSFYLLLASEAGLISTIIFVLVIIEVTTIIIPLIHNLNRESQLIASGLFCSNIIFLIHGLWEPKTLNDHIAIIFWMNLGLLMNLTSSKRILYGEKK